MKRKWRPLCLLPPSRVARLHLFLVAAAAARAAAHAHGASLASRLITFV